MTNLCYCIVESCNGAQEVEDRAALKGGVDIGSGLTANVFPVLTLPLPLSKGYQEPEKGESL